MIEQQNIFGSEKEYKLERLSNKTIIKSVSYSQTEILSWIIRLYCPRGFDLDPTYSKGNFYKLIPEPKIKMDLDPGPGIIPADARNLPLRSSSLESIIFDPPFLGASPVKPSKPGSNKIKRRFGSYKTFDELWSMYHRALEEFYRILNDRGVLIFKCQDGINDHKQYLSHVEIINYALQLGFYAIDLFILLAKSVIIGGNHHNQEHARKTHCYFLVFSKKGRNVIYTL
jgi:hypothetical protein